MIDAMEFTIQFDRNIDKNIHYITPGGYSVNGKRFDFCNYEGYVYGDKLHCVVHNFDEDFFKESSENKKYKSLTLNDFRIGFDEFFIYTGEYDDAEIIPKQILDLTVYIEGNGNTFKDKVLESATNAIAY